MLCIENNSDPLNIFQILGMPRTKEPKFTHFMSWLHIFLVLLLHQLLFVCIPTAHSMVQWVGKLSKYKNQRLRVFAYKVYIHLIYLQASFCCCLDCCRFVVTYFGCFFFVSGWLKTIRIVQHVYAYRSRSM